MDLQVRLCGHKSNTTQQSRPLALVHRCERQNKLDQLSLREECCHVTGNAIHQARFNDENGKNET